MPSPSPLFFPTFLFSHILYYTTSCSILLPSYPTFSFIPSLSPLFFPTLLFFHILLYTISSSIHLPYFSLIPHSSLYHLLLYSSFLLFSYPIFFFIPYPALFFFPTFLLSHILLYTNSSIILPFFSLFPYSPLYHLLNSHFLPFYCFIFIFIPSSSLFSFPTFIFFPFLSLFQQFRVLINRLKIVPFNLGSIVTSFRLTSIANEIAPSESGVYRSRDCIRVVPCFDKQVEDLPL